MKWLKPKTQRDRAQLPGARPSDPKRPAPANMPPRRTWLTFLAVILVNFLLVRLLFPGPDAPIAVPYTFFKEQVAKANVEAIYGRGEIIEGRFVAPVTYPPPSEQHATPSGKAQSATDRGAPVRGEPKTVHNFTTTLPSFVDPGLEKFLIDHQVEISAKPIQQGGNPWTTFLFGFGPALLIIVFYIWLFRRTAQQGGGLGSGLMGIGKSKARRYDQEQNTKVTFDDVAGIDEAENELVEIVDFLKEPESTRVWVAPLRKVYCW
jgi:cell division protease FtsH